MKARRHPLGRNIVEEAGEPALLPQPDPPDFPE